MQLTKCFIITSKQHKDKEKGDRIMKAVEAIIECLMEEDVKVVFGYPGATVVPLYEALRKSSIKHILVRQEQAAGHSASGYGRTTGTVGVCIVTSGPGATNIITSIATAYMDSIPLVIITGQVKCKLIGKDAFQEVDITGATESFTKYNYLVSRAQDIPKIIKEAFYIARTGRPGPVLIDIPVDLQEEEIEYSYPSEVNIRGYKPTIVGHKGQIKKAIERIQESKKPLICIGGGIGCSHAQKQLMEFVNKSKIPIVHTLMAKGCVDEESKYYIGLIGSHGFSYANKAVQNADVLILIGTRIADRATAGSKYFARDADIIHIDIDPAEIGKNLGINIPVVGDCKNILEELTNKIDLKSTDSWVNEVRQWKKDASVPKILNDKVNPKYALELLSKILEKDVIVTADVGQNQIWCARNFTITQNRCFLTTGGLGTMGYSLPAAIGSKIGNPSRRVVAITGDGGIQMSLAELGTICENKINITILIFNNSGLGMVREIQNNTYEGNYAVELKCNPNFVKIAEAYGLHGKKVNSNSELEEAFKEAFSAKKTFVIECMVDPFESTF